MANEQLCGCGCGSQADSNTSGFRWIKELQGLSFNIGCWQAYSDARTTGYVSERATAYAANIQAHQTSMNTPAPEGNPPPTEAPLITCACSPLAAATMGADCVYCHLRIHGVEQNQRRMMDLQGASTRSRMDSAEWRLHARRNPNTASSRELAKGHPSTWPSQEDEE